nr:hypothetical protein [Vagococcus allomyrinae]
MVAGSGLMYYRLSRIQGTIATSIINEELEETDAPKVVVYTQDRSFKNEVMKKVTADISTRPIYLEILPIEEISKDLDQWDKIVIFTTVQSSEPPENVLPIITKYRDDQRMGLFLTADSGEWAHQPDDVEALTAASRSLDNVDEFATQIISFITD